MACSAQVTHGIRNGVFTTLYIGLVVTFMQNASHWFGGPDTPYLTPFIGLTLFVVSALITGSLVLWQPVTLLIDGKRQEAGTMLAATGGTLVALMVIAGSIIILG